MESYILHTLEELVTDRGFVFCEENQVQNKEKEENLCVLRNPSQEEIEESPKDPLYVLWFRGASLQTAHIQQAQEYLPLSSAVILVVGSAKNAPLIKQYRTRSRLDIFEERELYRNITRHKLYMPHRLLSTKESGQVLKRYFLKNKEKFPRIYRTDPVVKYFGWQVGSILEIKRFYGEDMCPIRYWRVVVDPPWR